MSQKRVADFAYGARQLISSLHPQFLSLLYLLSFLDRSGEFVGSTSNERP